MILFSICNFLKRFKLNLYSFVNAHDGSLGKIDFDFKNFKVWTFDAVFLKMRNKINEFIFRVDVTKEVGIGHLKRMINFGNQLNVKKKCYMVYKR